MSCEYAHCANARSSFSNYESEVPVRIGSCTMPRWSGCAHVEQAPRSAGAARRTFLSFNLYAGFVRMNLALGPCSAIEASVADCAPERLSA